MTHSTGACFLVENIILHKRRACQPFRFVVRSNLIRMLYLRRLLSERFVLTDKLASCALTDVADIGDIRLRQGTDRVTDTPLLVAYQTDISRYHNGKRDCEAGI